MRGCKFSHCYVQLRRNMTWFTKIATTSANILRTVYLSKICRRRPLAHPISADPCKCRIERSGVWFPSLRKILIPSCGERDEQLEHWKGRPKNRDLTPMASFSGRAFKSSYSQDEKKSRAVWCHCREPLYSWLPRLPRELLRKLQPECYELAIRPTWRRCCCSLMNEQPDIPRFGETQYEVGYI